MSSTISHWIDYPGTEFAPSGGPSRSPRGLTLVKKEEMTHLNAVDWVSLVLTTIGALNWGLIGIFGFNLVRAVFGGVPALESLIYIVVGLAGLWQIYLMARLAQRQPVIGIR